MPQVEEISATKEIFLSLAQLFLYPGFDFDRSEEEYSEYKKKVDSLIELISHKSEAAGETLKAFRESIERLSALELEEVYTTTFDISPTCYIYSGYLLFGESNKRLEFLVKLKEKFREFGFAEDAELSDHISILMKFLAHIDDTETLFSEIMEDCLIPSINIMKRSFTRVLNDKKEIDVSRYFKNDRNPYFYLITMTEQYCMTLVPEDYVPIKVSPEKAEFDPEDLYEDQNDSVCGGCSVPEKALKTNNRPPFIKFNEKIDLNANHPGKTIEGEIK